MTRMIRYVTPIAPIAGSRPRFTRAPTSTKNSTMTGGLKAPDSSKATRLARRDVHEREAHGHVRENQRQAIAIGDSRAQDDHAEDDDQPLSLVAHHAQGVVEHDAADRAEQQGTADLEQRSRCSAGTELRRLRCRG